MMQEKLIKDISKQVENLGFFVVDIHVDSQGKILVFMDSMTGNVSIEDCVTVSRAIVNIHGDVIGKYGIEVSSPGLNYPFKVRKQYEKNIGNDLSILMKDGKKIKGKLLTLKEEKIVLAELKIQKENKKKTEKVIEHEILFTQIKSTKPII